MGDAMKATTKVAKLQNEQLFEGYAPHRYIIFDRNTTTVIIELLQVEVIQQCNGTMNFTRSVGYV
jgi:hypothetical protein